MLTQEPKVSEYTICAQRATWYQLNGYTFGEFLLDTGTEFPFNLASQVWTDLAEQ